MPELMVLNRQRGRVKAKLTAFSNFIARVEAMPEHKEELPLRVEKAENLLSEFEVIQGMIEDIDDTDQQIAERREFEDTYYHLITKARRLQINEGAPPLQVQQPNFLAPAQPNAGNGQFALRPAVKLPTIELPKFDGNYELWIPFRDLFESIIASNVLIPSVQKLHYLRSALVGEAASVIASLDITNDNYEIAWNLLKQRFENKKLITHHLIQTLLDLPSVAKESHADLRQLADNISQITQNLAKLGQPVEHFAIWVIHIILPKIDKGSRREWEFKRSEIEEFPTLNEFITFIISRSACLEAVSRANRNAQSFTDNRGNKTIQGQGKNTSKAYLASNNMSCPVCANSHKIYECESFLKMSIADRNVEIKKKNLCIKCLKQFHGKNCRASNCRLCKGYHNSLLHRSKSSMELSNEEAKSASSNNNNVKNVEQQSAKVSSSNASISLNNHAIKGSSQVLLSTAALFIYDSDGMLHKCRALLDSGSQSNFITRRLSDKLKLSYKPINKTIMGISDTPISTIQQADAIIKSCTNAYQVRLPFLIIDRITDQLPTSRINENSLNIPCNLKLADPQYHTPGDIDLLLGASIFWQLLGRRQIRSSSKAPILQETALGWIISGNMQDGSTHQYRSKTYCGLLVDTAIQKQLERFWRIEEVNHTDGHSQDEIWCEEHFASTHARNEEGRFIIQLPLKGNIQELGESCVNAEKRLRSLERKLERCPELKQRYHEFMREYICLGHMTEIPSDQISGELSYYIPHHAVIKEDSETTKLRVVFDASCKTTNGRSLNDFLRIGPNLQDDLFDIITRLRQYKYAMTADITKMYRQVQVNEKHRKFQRILWRWSREEPIRIFELNTVTYGMSSSSFSAIRCLQELSQQFKTQYPIASQVISRDFYVDDLLTGTNSIEELKKLKHDVTSILCCAKFELNKWKSNTTEVNKLDNQTTVRLGEETKILGLWWNTDTDTFHYHVKSTHVKEKVTKRNILSKTSEIYDPLGWIGPAVVQAKIILQRLWQMNKDWDESITGEIRSMWTQWKTQITSLENISIPRKVICDDALKIEMHGFCDASEVAYGACVYLRSVNSEGKYTVRLLCAKSRIAPIKKISLPRLELCGAMLLAHLSQKVSKALTIKPQSTHYWSDSTIALSWISSESNKWHTFVANRVAEISRITNGAPWYHVKSEDNPADPLSRGVNPKKMESMTCWFEGPHFLRSNTSLKPFKSENTLKDVPEARSINLATQEVNIATDTSIIHKYSSLTRLKHIIAYCLRFKSNALNSEKRTNEPLTVQELDKALMVTIKICQATEFYQELHDLRHKKQLDSKSKLLTLHPFLDANDIIRVGGRLRHAPIEYSRKHPIILPSKHHLTELIIRDTHYKNLHAGSQAILSTIRSDYWIISGKNAVRRVLRKCIICFRTKPIIATQLMGSLPANRVTQARAFINTGVDYAGPFNIKISRNKSGKAYLSIFVCLSTKAVHFELVSDLSATSFLNAIKRFVARRGKCINLYSDNSTTFVGANNQLLELKEFFAKGATQSQIQAHLAEQSINWKFIPPYSPHMGGLWEAAVKSAKTHMKRVIGATILNFEELYTILVQIEALLNSRPLTPISNDPTDPQALTPGHFIIGEALNTIPERDLSEIPINRLNRYQLITQMRQSFWSRWSQEYISQLQQRFKWKRSEKSNIKVGTMVLVKNESTPPMIWPLGRIAETHPGADGIVRVVTIKTGHGLIKRALSKVCILPIDDNTQM